MLNPAFKLSHPYQVCYLHTEGVHRELKLVCQSDRFSRFTDPKLWACHEEYRRFCQIIHANSFESQTAFAIPPPALAAEFLVRVLARVAPR